MMLLLRISPNESIKILNGIVIKDMVNFRSYRPI